MKPINFSKPDLIVKRYKMGDKTIETMQHNPHCFTARAFNIDCWGKEFCV